MTLEVARSARQTLVVSKDCGYVQCHCGDVQTGEINCPGREFVLPVPIWTDFSPLGLGPSYKYEGLSVTDLEVKVEPGRVGSWPTRMSVIRWTASRYLTEQFEPICKFLIWGKGKYELCHSSKLSLYKSAAAGEWYTTVSYTY